MAIDITYDRMKELKAFDETKAGVKGLVDSGIEKVPRIFLHSPENLLNPSDVRDTDLEVPVIDLEGIGDANRRKEIVDEVCEASETWGFFQVVNHGVPLCVMDAMMQATSRFHEQDVEVKAKHYSRDPMKKVKFACNFDLFTSPAANWRDTLVCMLESLDPKELPSICREEVFACNKHVSSVAETLCELLSEALGLNTDHLTSINAIKTQVLLAHYYPPCPEPDLTLGTTKHADPSFLTLLIQDDLGGLQVLHGNQWIRVAPIHGAIIVNIGDLFQLISNDKFKSVEHRVVASYKGPRLSVATFFHPSDDEKRPYGPISEALSDGNPLRYQEILMRDYSIQFARKGLGRESALDHFKLRFAREK